MGCIPSNFHYDADSLDQFMHLIEKITDNKPDGLKEASFKRLKEIYNERSTKYFLRKCEKNCLIDLAEMKKGELHSATTLNDDDIPQLYDIPMPTKQIVVKLNGEDIMSQDGAKRTSCMMDIVSPYLNNATNEEGDGNKMDKHEEEKLENVTQNLKNKMEERDKRVIDSVDTLKKMLKIHGDDCDCYSCKENKIFRLHHRMNTTIRKVSEKYSSDEILMATTESLLSIFDKEKQKNSSIKTAINNALMYYGYDPLPFKYEVEGSSNNPKFTSKTVLKIAGIDFKGTGTGKKKQFADASAVEDLINKLRDFVSN